jgi:hypothetical protein
MMALRLRLLVFLALASNSHVPAQAASWMPDEANVTEIFDNAVAELSASSEWLVKPHLAFKEEGIRSLPSGEVLVDLSELESVLEDVEGNYRPLVVKFVIAHEIWHQVQYRIYGLDATEDKYKQQKTLECQADMMAAHYLAAEIGSATELQQKAVATLPEFAFVLGRLSDGLLHPSEIQRRLAVEIGLQRAIHDGKFPIGDRETLANIRKTTLMLADIKTGERLAQWSLRQCRMVIHDDKELLQGLAVEPEGQKIEWEKTQGFVRFAVPFRNITNLPLRVSLEITSAAVSRKERGDLSKSRRVLGLRYNFDIEPNAVFTASGVLAWYATDELMPRLLIPPAEGSLISVERLPALRKRPDGNTEDDENASDLIAQIRTANSLVTTDAGNQFRNLRTSVDWSDGDSTKYNTGLNFPFAKEAAVILERRGESRVDVNFADTNEKDARELFDKYLNAYQTIYKATLIKREDRRDEMPSATIQVGRLVEVEFYVYKDRDDDTFSFNVVYYWVRSYD